MPFYPSRVIRQGILVGLLLFLPSAFPSTPAEGSVTPLETRVEDLFRQLTPDEKIFLLGGNGFSTHAIPRLKIPPLEMVDASEGIRGGSRGTQGPSTLFPACVCMASTWDTDLIERVGQAIGTEAKNKGTGAQVLLGPGLNIHRSPLGGRNSEYFSEDPYLASRLAVSYVRGVQSTGVAACVKHFVCNNQETDRGEVDVEVGERALREIYLPAFEAAIREGHAWAVMPAYNKVRGLHMTANPYLLTDILRKDWGFDGLTLSDWGAVHDTVPVLEAGNDLEMPRPGYMTPERLSYYLRKGKLSQKTVDEAVRRILRTIIRCGLMDGPQIPNHKLATLPQHQSLAYMTAAEGIVLLKNRGGVLPLNRKEIHTIAIIGRSARDMQFGSAGSAHVTPFYSISPLEGITRTAGSGIQVNYLDGLPPSPPVPATVLVPAGNEDGHGLLGEYFPNRNLSGQPALVRTDETIDFDWSRGDSDLISKPGLGKNNFSVRWTGKLIPPASGTYTLCLKTDDGARLYLDGKLLINHWVETSADPFTVEVDLVAGHVYDLRIEYFQAYGDASAQFAWITPRAIPYSEAIDAARKADIAIVCVSTKGTEAEGHDRPSFELPNQQDDLIRAVSACNRRTIVILNNGTPVSMKKWLDGVPAVVETWFPGQEGGQALADILFGNVNPSGKLPDTFGVDRDDYPDAGNFPGTNLGVHYSEGIYVGYRHFDKALLIPFFPFGHGLSYTTFEYKNIHLSRPSIDPGETLQVSVDVTNTGKLLGEEVVQLYLHDPHPKIDKPVRELKGFARISLIPGETKPVSFELKARDLAYCDVAGKQWKADAGDYDIEIGASSRDIRQKATFRLGDTFTESILLMTKPVVSKEFTHAVPEKN